jgi:hypothetical protein
VQKQAGLFIVKAMAIVQEDVAYELRAWRDSIQDIRLVPGRQPWMPVSIFVDFNSEEDAAECVQTFSSGFRATTSRSVGVVEFAKC